MRTSGFSHSPFTAHDPIRAAEDDIRRYLIRCGVIAAPETKPGKPQTVLCLLSLYVIIAFAVALGWFVLTRLECDPFFSDRGLTAACRNHSGALAKIVGPAGNGYSGFMPASLSQ